MVLRGSRRRRRRGDRVNLTPSRHLGVPAEAAEHSHDARVVEDAVNLADRRVPLVFGQSRLLGVVGQIEPGFLDVVVVEVELRDDDLVEALELGAVREVGLLFFFFLGLLLGFRRFLVVGPTRALRDVSSRTRRRASP